MRLTTLFSLILLSTVMALAGPRHYSSNIEGDVNADGDVNIADINMVIDDILKGIGNPMCDVNQDGDVNIADINMVIKIILEGPDIHVADNGMYLGIIGYNQSLTTKELSPLDSTTVTEFNDFVDGLTTQSGRLLYYSVDNALDALNAANCPTNLQNVAVITFKIGRAHV